MKENYFNIHLFLIVDRSNNLDISLKLYYDITNPSRTIEDLISKIFRCDSAFLDWWIVRNDGYLCGTTNRHDQSSDPTQIRTGTESHLWLGY